MYSRKFQQKLTSQWQRLYRVAYAWCHDPALAMDLTQDTMVKALKQQSQLRENEAFNRWLFTILLNNWRDYCRRHHEVLDDSGELLSHERTPEREAGNLESLERIREACACLNQDQREVLSLVVLEGLSYGDTASVLGISQGTVMSRLCRAREGLRKELARMGEPVARASSVTSFRRVK